MITLEADVRSFVKSMLASKGWTMKSVVSVMNKMRSPEDQTTVQNISNKLTRGTIKFAEVAEIASIIGYKLCADTIGREEPQDE